MNVEPYNFHKPSQLATELGQRLSDWQNGICTLVAEKWGQHLLYSVELTADSLVTWRSAEAMEQLPNPAFGCQIQLGSDGPQTLLVCSRQTALALMLGFLGDTGEELPPDREPTVIEQSLGQMAMQELVQAIEESWSGPEPLSCRSETLELRSRRFRMFAADETIVVAPFTLSAPFGTGIFYWLLPQEGLETLLSQTNSQIDRETRENARPKLEALAQQITVEVTVHLGRTTLHVTELASLRCGDVLILDQRVAEPLVANVVGRAKFRGWPGRVGSRQAFQVESLTEC